VQITACWGRKKKCYKNKESSVNIQSQEVFTALGERIEGNRASESSNTNKEFLNRYNSIVELISELKAIKPVDLKPSQVVIGLKAILWPIKSNILEQAEAICFARMSQILAQLLTGDNAEGAASTSTNECLQALLFLGNMLEAA
jgi:hypothetical protein